MWRLPTSAKKRPPRNNPYRDAIHWPETAGAIPKAGLEQAAHSSPAFLFAVTQCGKVVNVPRLLGLDAGLAHDPAQTLNLAAHEIAKRAR